MDVKFTAAQADAVLLNASALLQKKNSPSDHACCVVFVRDGAIKVFGKKGDGLDRPNDLSSVRNVFHSSPEKVKVVSGIQRQSFWETLVGSNNPAAQFDGMAYPGLTMIVEATSTGEVWAHEFGHLKHLWTHSDDPRSLMHNPASSSGEVTEEQCRAFQEGGSEM